MMQEPILEVKNIGKAYRSYESEWQRVFSWFGLTLKPAQETWTLRDINFSIMPGEAVGIIGQNGAGKSTLLKIITGTLKPTTGSVTVRGKIAAILELGMGFHPDLTGRQNAYHSAGLMGYTQEQIDGMIADIESFAEIGEYFEQPVRTYSSGMQARVAFAVATAFRPDILIVDEALSVGDARFQAKCFKRMADFKNSGCTFILVSHSIEDINKHCERVLYLKHGSLKVDGNSKMASNIYLDDMFGSKSKVQDSEITQLSLSLQEEYHLREGYLSSEHRWGEGGARILDYSLFSNGKLFPYEYKTNEKFKIILKVLYEVDIQMPVIGILIKSIDGIFLYGTNSDFSGSSLPPVKSGSVKLYEFSFPLNLNTGDFLISLGISYYDNNTGENMPLDRRYDSINLRVSRDTFLWGIIELNASFQEIKVEEVE